MAIILNNTRRLKAAIPPAEFIEQKGLCRETTIKVKANGEIMVKTNDGEYKSGNDVILNLGYQGDNLVTLINIDTTELHWGDLSNKDSYPNGVQLKDAYQPVLIFKNAVNPDEDSYSVEFEGNYFLLPSEITKKATTYNIIFTLQERLSGGGE